MMFGRLAAAAWGAALGTVVLIAVQPAAAQDSDDEGLPTVAEKVDGLERIDGLFPLYQDTETGALFMEISGEQLGDEFISFSYVENGVLDAGAFKGAYGGENVIRFDRHYDRIELSVVNTSFYFDEDNAISRAKEANISPAIVGSLEILAETEGGGDEPARFLISADELFKGETLTTVTPLPNPFAGPFAFQVGGLDREKTKYAGIRGYPENVDVVVDYVFSNPMPLNQGSAAVTDARSVTLKVQNSIIAMPEPGFEPRFDDYRIGYFTNRVTDLTSFEAAPYRDVISRWRLEKKDPEAELSEPVEPITWWIENTTPEEYRETIKEGVLIWNEAFEAAGFKNAMRVEVQPDDADWDAGDIRYNVLRWTSSPNPPFGGYGPSFTNPRTGEILGADIMLELVFLKSAQIAGDSFDTAALPAEFQLDNTPPKPGESLPDHSRLLHADTCVAGRELQAKLGFATAALQAAGASDAEVEELKRQSLITLISHEVGHTLGLNHNMKGTIVYGPEEVHDASVTKGAPSNSVMDYHATNIAPPGVEQGDYEHTRVGAYDIWAIEFGYKPEADDPEIREAILSRSNEKMLAFGNDADDMRSPANGIDPRVMIRDHSSDPVEYAIGRMELVRATLPELLSRYAGEGEDSYQKLLSQYLFLTGQQATQARVISKQIGGVYVERVRPGQDDTVPYTPVPLVEQKKAMEALGEYVFAADAFEAPGELLRHLQQQRRGYDFFFNTEDPKITARALAIQNGVLAQVLHPNTMRRLTDTELYGNEYSAAEMIQDLNDVIFGNDLVGSPNAFRRNLQIAYTQRLVFMAYGFVYDPVAQGAALAGIQDIKSRFGLVPEFMLPLETRAHRAALRLELGWVD